MDKAHKIIRQKKVSQGIAFSIFGIITSIVVLILCGILYFIFVRGWPAMSWKFLTTMPTNGMTDGGIYPAIIGTFCLIGGSMLFAFPIGVLSGIGLFGMALFVNKLKFGDSILAGSLTLGLLALPVIIRTTEEALKSVDDAYRIASLALGASKLQTVRKVVLPIAFPNILTGLILSVGRVSGETAPILFTVAAYFLPRLPHSIYDQVMALPYHLYVICTSGTDIVASRKMAYGTALVLILIVLISNILAGIVRSYFTRKNKI